MSSFTPKALINNAFARRRAALASHGELRAQLLEEARAEADDAIAAARSLENLPALARALELRAQLARDDGDHLRARALLEDLLDLRRREDNPQALAGALLAMADLDAACGARASALEGIDDAISIYREDGQTPVRQLAQTLCTRSELLVLTGGRQPARAGWFEAAALYAQIDDDDGVIACQSKIAELAFG